MNFNTIEFLYLFLPITLILFYLAPCKARLPILIVSSFIFYAYADLIPFYFLIISIFWSFFLNHDRNCNTQKKNKSKQNQTGVNLEVKTKV